MPNDNKLYGENYIANACRAIRVKNGLSTEYRAMDMEAAILAIPTGSGGVNYLTDVCNDSYAFTLPAEALAGVTHIKPHTFRGSKVTSVVFPSNLATIGAYAFYQSGLTSVDLPDSVTLVGEHAFDGIQADTFILRPTTPPTLENNCFGVPATSSGSPYIYVPDASFSSYRSSNVYYGSHFRKLSTLPT